MKILRFVPLAVVVLPLGASCSPSSTGLPLGSGGSAAGGLVNTTGGVGSGANTSGGAANSGGASSGGAASGGASSGGGAGGGASSGGASSGGSSSGGSHSGGGNSGGASSGGSGGTPSSGGMVNVPDPPRLQNPQDGHATHYWDCCKPSCAWPDQGKAHACTVSNELQSKADEQSGCFGGNAYQCWSMSPWAVSDTLAYGFAAFNSGSCGTCYQLEFTGTSSSSSNDPGSAAISKKFMIVQTLNRGGIGNGQFDLLVPGGGVGDFDACSKQWNASGSLGERYGGFFLECRKQNANNHEAMKECARNKCESIFNQPNEEDLLSGCLFWVDWANMADNPNFKYGQVQCPAAISEVSGM